MAEQKAKQTGDFTRKGAYDGQVVEKGLSSIGSIFWGGVDNPQRAAASGFIIHLIGDHTQVVRNQTTICEIVPLQQGIAALRALAGSGGGASTVARRTKRGAKKKGPANKAFKRASGTSASARTKRRRRNG